MKVDYLRDGSDLLSELSAFATSASTDAGVMEVVSDIIASVKKNGDSALLEKTKIYDHAELQADDLRISQRRLDQSIESLSGEDVKALEEAIDKFKEPFKKKQ